MFQITPFIYIGNQLVDIKHPTAVRMNIHTPTPIVPTSPINLNSNNVTSVNTQSPGNYLFFYRKAMKSVKNRFD